MRVMVSEAAPRPTTWRLVAWLVFVLILTALAYSAQFADSDTPDDIAYRWVSSVAAVVQYGVMLAILLLIARGLPRSEAFALRRPTSWPRAAGYAALALVAIYVVSYVYVLLSNADPTDEQGLVPDEWDSSRLPAFIAFFAAVAVLAPVVEELTYRGLGFGLLEPYGRWVAIVTTGVLFGAAHGLLAALPILAFFGIAVGWLRSKTDSVYPGMLLHGTFNGLALIVAVAAS
jgi:membrane protease YdiL (CAAX protease family)